MSSAAELSEAKRRLLERMLSGDAPPDEDQRANAVLPRPPGTVAPISADQEHVWLHAATSPDLPLYNEAITIHRTGGFDLVALEYSLNQIVRRNEIWRTSFEQRDGHIVQVVHEEIRVRLPVADLSGLPSDEREAEALRLATEDARLPFDLARGPLFRARVVRMAPEVHRLYLTLHHIIFDGVSIYRIFVPELIAGYDAFIAMRDRPPTSIGTLQYGDYAVWRERQLTTERVTRQLDYWRDRLAGMQAALELPSDRPYPATPSHRGGMETFALEPPLVRRLEALGQEHGATLYMVLLAAFGTLLHRISGVTDLAIGGVTDTRRRPELASMFGYFLNSIVLRTRPTGDLPFRDYLVQVRRTVLEALDNSDVPFAHVVRGVQPRREPGRHPLVNVMFSMEPPAPVFPQGWDLTQMDVPVAAAKFDLYLELDERPEAMVARFLYSRDLFEPDTIRRMIGHYETLLGAVAADPGRTLALLPLLTAAETQQLEAWNDTSEPIAHTTLYGWFEIHARRTPDAVAVRFEDEAWTYGRLDKHAGQLAARLRAAGIGRGGLVAVCVDRSPQMVAGLLAALKAGGAFLPLDPDLPKARLQRILDEAKPAALLAERRLLSILPEYRDLIVALDDGDAAGVSAMNESTADADAPAGPEADDLAYVIYTSGSTGTPKGVEVLHRGVVNLLASAQRNPGFGARDTLLAVATVSFDMAVLELFLPLVSGGCIALASRSDALDPRRLMALIDRIKPTLMAATPATWRALLDAGWSGSGDLRILCGGEALPRDLANRLAARCARLWNIYGPTETAIYSTIGEVTPDFGPVPIGRPVANTKTLILDAHGQAVPVGVAGELHIAGAGLARGYRGRSDLTEERFVFSAALPGTRLYRTGDIARYRHDGAIEFLGRNDDQVKIRGFRIELGEVEAALARLPGVAAAAVKAWPDATGERALTAYLVAEPGTALDWGELRRGLGQVLPAYMVPSRHLSLSALPLSANRKLDRAALPEPGFHEARPVVAEPTGEQERKLAAIWADVLGLPSVGATDNFFDLGGHSLMLARLLQRIEAEIGVKLSMDAVFRAPTVRQMAELHRERRLNSQVPGIIEIQPNGTRPTLFWVYAGPAMWSLAKALGPDQPFLGVVLEPGVVAALGDKPDLVTMASALVRSIRAVQPTGPYDLGGFCNSGVLAYETALQLIAAGQEVRLLVLLDSFNPLHYRQIGQLSVVGSKLRYHGTKFASLRSRQRWAYGAARIANIGARFMPRHWRMPATLQWGAFEYVLHDAVLRYRPPPYPGNVVLLQAADRLDVFDHTPGWPDTVHGEFTMREVVGNHESMLEQPNVRGLAEEVNVCLDWARLPLQDRPGAQK